MEFDERKIELNRELNDLDKFAIKFLEILEKYTEYVVISGYVAILLGRTRATDDIDVFIKPISKEKFRQLYAELREKDFWCLNAEDENELFSFLEDKLAIRFAKKGLSTPNFEVKFPKDKLDEEAFNNTIKVILPEGKIIISELERQIAFKRYHLESNKDEEDALHVEELFKGKIDYNKVNKYRELIEKRKKDEDKRQRNFYETRQNKSRR